MKQYKIRVIDDDQNVHNVGTVWASNSYNALNIAAVKRYGPYGWDIVSDNTIIGYHVRRRGQPAESMSIEY